jgi:hypothetical protein
MIAPEFSALLTMFIVLSPLFTSVFLLFHSFFNNNLQGIVYLAFIIIVQILGYLARPLFGGVRPDIAALERGEKYFSKHRACDIIEDPWFSKYSSPSFHAIHHSFTFVYIFIYEMVKYKLPKDWVMFIIFLIILISDGIFRVANGCVFMSHYIYGILFGSLFGMLCYYLINSFNPTLVYNSYESDIKKCKLENSKMNCKMELWEFNSDNNTSRLVNPDEMNGMNMAQWVLALRNSSTDSSTTPETPTGTTLEPPSHKHGIPELTVANNKVATSNTNTFGYLPASGPGSNVVGN